MNNFISGILAGIVIATALLCTFALGVDSGINRVVRDCGYYQKYALDGTQVLLCSAIITPQELMPAVADTNAKFYSKENKDLHKKDRK